MLRLIERYSEPHRKYRNFNHIATMLDNMKHFNNLSEIDKEILRLAILYHDYVYYPTSKNNEVDSTTEMLKHMINNEIIFNKDLISQVELAAKARELILCTIKHEPTIYLSKYIIDLDLWELADAKSYTKNQNLIYEEFSLAGYSVIQIAEGRLKWLNSMIARKQMFYTNFCIEMNFEERTRINLQSELNTYS